MRKYDPSQLEPKWQQVWQKTGLYKTTDTPGQENYYCLTMFPYPSGDLHTGHWFAYTGPDIIARFNRMLGKNVLHPIGFDAFGLPAENAAIKRQIPPAKWTKQNIANMSKQLRSLGTMYDWEKTLDTSDPEYYRWTQWLFLRLYEAGLAYRAKGLQNWCPKDQTVLANEQVILEAGLNVCERCGTPVEQKELEQWFFKITDYADRLLEDLEKLDWPQRVKLMQQNWIGKSQGAEIKFALANYPQILVATNNPAKVKRMRQLLAKLPRAPQLVTPAELRISTVDVKEGSDLAANAIAKAQAFRDQTELPVLGTDTGFFIAGANHDPAKVRRNALKGKDESLLSQDEQADLMLDYYQQIATSHSGQVEAYWQDEFALVLTDGSVQTASARREVTLTDKPKKPVDKFFPLRSLYINHSTGKYAADQTKHEEEEVDLLPYRQALEELLTPAIRVFTTRADTLYGATYMVLAPEHPLVDKITTKSQQAKVTSYQAKVAKKTELERLEAQKAKTGVFTGAYAINPVNQAKIPVWVADYVLMSYGTGAIMAVPAHDERDHTFATKFKLPIKPVIKTPTNLVLKSKVYVGEGKLYNSGQLSGVDSTRARQAIVDDLADQQLARHQTNYKLRDWLISRQRYWGAPIPVVYCDRCGVVPVSEDQLPVLLPEDVEFAPTGRSPLLQRDDFVNTTCPRCRGAARREVDTMDTFVDSSWYYLRFPNPRYQLGLLDPKAVSQWLPVQHYLGGIEHAILHLLYSRFITKFLQDQKLISFSEPFLKLSNQGTILGADGHKMSKSRGNVVSPDEQVAAYGADTFRTYLMFTGPWEDGGPFDTQGIAGTRRFLDRVWVLVGEFTAAQPADNSQTGSPLAAQLTAATHRTIQRVTADIKRISFNTAIAAMMELVNLMNKSKAELTYTQAATTWVECLDSLVKLLAPFAPHISEDLWQQLGHDDSVHIQTWPTWDEALVGEDITTLVVQVNGKVRANLAVEANLTDAQLTKLAQAEPKIQPYLTAGKVVKTIVVPNKLVNFVVSNTVK